MLKLGQVLTLKNCIEPFSYASTAYVVASALVSVQPICKNLSNLQKIFGQMVYRPPWPKIARTPMIIYVAKEVVKNVYIVFLTANYNYFLVV